MMFNKLKNLLMKSSLVFVILFLSWIIVATIFRTPSGDFPLSFLYASNYNLLIFLSAFVLIGILYFLYQFFKKKQFQPKYLWIISGCLFFILLAIQYFTRNLLVEPSWDFGHLYNGALDFMQGTVDYPYTWNYLSTYSNNLFIFVFEVLMVNVANFFNILDYNLFCWFCNAIMIDLSVIFLFLCMKKVHSLEMALLSLLICIFVAPLILYTPIFYTDTFSIFFPILLFYLYSFVRKKEVTKRNFWIIGLMGFVAVIGMKFKMTVFIAVIAIFIDIILQHRFKKVFLLFSLFLFGSGIGFISVLLLEQPVKKHYRLEESLKMPMTHYIMMGLHGRGGYDAYDTDYSNSFKTTEEKASANILRIKETLNNYTIWSYLQFLNHKLLFTWSDGTYFVDQKLNVLPLKTDSFISSIVLPNGKYYKVFVLFANSVHTALLILLLLGAISSLFQKKYDQLGLFVSILGIGLFLLIWETRSRYLYNFIPIFIAAALPTLDNFTFKSNKKVLEVNSK